jgi:hypothetical protein
MSEHITLLAKNIEVDTLQKTVVKLSYDLAAVTHEHGVLKTAYNQLHETAAKQADDMSQANVALILEKNAVDECRGRQQTTIAGLEDDILSARHQLEREQIIHAHIFAEIKNGSAIILLPNHKSLGKVKKADLRIETDHGQTLSGIVTYIDDLYQKIDNPELRRLLRA